MPCFAIYYLWCSLVAFFASLSIATISFQQSGWLDRVVQYHKNRFISDLKKLPLVKISIEPAPYGYEDPNTWDLDSVLRLLDLMQHNNNAAPVLQHLHRSMSGRRFMSIAESLKAFPSLAKNHPNYFYYEVESDDYEVMSTSDPGEITDESIIVVSNPAEARLPAAQISVRLLKEILEARAAAARYMPSSRSTIIWKPMNKTKSDAGGGGGGGGGSGSSDVGNGTDVGGGALGGGNQSDAASGNGTQKLKLNNRYRNKKDTAPNFV